MTLLYTWRGTGLTFTFSAQEMLEQFLTDIANDPKVSSVVTNGLTVTLDYDSGV